MGKGDANQDVFEKYQSVRRIIRGARRLRQGAARRGAATEVLLPECQVSVLLER
jgi:hypothetical protein